MKTIIERGASWTLDETRLLLTLWGQDQVQRKDTPHKRTKEVYEKIASMFNQKGFERTPEQVRTRVFNMIAEYRRILKDPNPEKMKKCVFFNAMHNIYQAQHWSDVKALVDDYDPETTFSPQSSVHSEINACANDYPISDDESSAPLDGLNHDSTSMDASNAGNSVNNNNNNDSTPKPSTNNDTATHKPSTNNDTTTDAATHNSNSESGTNNNTSATRDNIVNNSINETLASKKNPAASVDKPASSKKIKLEPPKAGTSQGATTADTNTNSVDGKHSKSSTSNNVGATTSSTSNAQNASSSSSHSTAQASHSTMSGKLQSLLAASTPSTSSTTSAPAASRPAPTSNNSTSQNNFNSTKSPFIRRPNGGEPINTNGAQPTTARLQATAAITSHQLYQAPVNTFDVTSSALLIDRMFAHLSRESENMREWIALEKDRIALEKARRAQEVERETRRERVLIDTLMKFQEQWISFISRKDPRFKDSSIPQMIIPPKENDTQGSSAASHPSLIDLPADVSGSSTNVAPVKPTTSASGNQAESNSTAS